MKVRKNKKATISDTPLEPIAIAQVKESKFGLIGMLFVIGIFVAAIYYLPEIEQLYQVYVKGNTAVLDDYPTNNNTSTNNTTNNNDTNDEQNQIDDISYKFGQTSEVIIDSLTFNNIILSGNQLSINIENSTKSNVKLDNQNLFMEIYDVNDNLLNRIWLIGQLESESNLILMYNVKSNADYFKIKVIPESDYTYEDFTIDDDQIVLTCDKDDEQIIYTFVDEKLTSVKHTETYLKSNSDYDSVYGSLSSLVMTYNGKAGIKTIFNSNETGLNFQFNVDYTTFNLTINNNYYFDSSTSPRVVKFKMESMFFDCK